MQKEEGLTPAQGELERALAGLRPIPMSIERDRLMFRAGQASVRRRNLIWPAAAAVLTVLLGASLFYRETRRQPEPEVIERVEYAPMERHTENMISSLVMESGRRRGNAQYIKLRDKVLAEGPGALPEENISWAGEKDELMVELQKIRTLGIRNKIIFKELY